MNTMEIQPITLTLGQARGFARAPEPLDQWLPEPLEEELRQYGVDYTGVEWPAGRLAETVLFEYNFYSDETATARIYSLDGREFLLAEKYGDRGNWVTQFLSVAVFREFVEESARLALEARLAGVTDRDPDTIPLGGHQQNFGGYVAFSETPAGPAVHFLSPKWGEYQWRFRDHTAIHDGEPVEFVRWADDRPSWAIGTDEPDAVLRWRDGTDRVVAGRRTRFLLDPSPSTGPGEPR
jgi:hypothetical protein